MAVKKYLIDFCIVTTTLLSNKIAALIVSVQAGALSLLNVKEGLEVFILVVTAATVVIRLYLTAKNRIKK